jgi:hypothetical protein
MSYISNYSFIILLIVIVLLYYYFIANNNEKNLKEQIKEGFENSNQYKSKYDSQFVPIKLLGSKNLINDRNLLERKLLRWEYPFNGHNAGYTNLGWPPLAPIYSYPTLNFHSPNGPTKENYNVIL